MFRCLSFALALLVLQGCTVVRSNVEVFHVLPADYQGKTIAVSRVGIESTRQIEFETYARKLEARLAEVGFAVVPESEVPEYVAVFAYAVGEGEEVVSSYSIPQYGVTGYSSSYTSGTISPYGTYSGTTSYTPTYGITGYSTVVGSQTSYPRVIVVSIHEFDQLNPAASKQVYSLTIGSSGRCANLSSVFDQMLEAGFEVFPGESGKPRTVKIAKDGGC